MFNGGWRKEIRLHAGWGLLFGLTAAMDLFCIKIVHLLRCDVVTVVIDDGIYLSLNLN